MRKISLMLAGFMMLAVGVSCQADLDDKVSHERDIKLRSSYDGVLQVFGDLVGDMNRQEVPATIADEALHKAVFAAAVARLVDGGSLGTTGVYTGIYQSWRIGSEEYNGMQPSNSHAMAAMSSLQRPDFSSVMARMAVDPTELLMETFEFGENFIESYYYLSSLTDFYTMGDTEKRNAVLNDVPGLIRDAGFNRTLTMLQMTTGTNIVNSALANRTGGIQRPYENCFTLADGFDYLRTRYPSRTLMLDVLEYYLPAIVASGSDDDHITLTYYPALLFDNPVLIAAFTDDEADLLCKIIAAAGNASLFWREKFGEFEIEEFILSHRTIETDFMGGSFDITVTTSMSSTNWIMGASDNVMISLPSAGFRRGSQTVTITVNPNYANAEERYGYVDFYYGVVSTGEEGSRRLEIYQGANDSKVTYRISGAYSSTGTTAKLKSGMQKVQLTVIPNGNYRWFFDTRLAVDDGWIADKITGVGETVVTLTIDNNNRTLPHTFVVPIRLEENQFETFYYTITQDAHTGWYFQRKLSDLTESLYDIGREGGYVTIPVITNYPGWAPSTTDTGLEYVSSTSAGIQDGFRQGHGTATYYVSPYNGGRKLKANFITVSGTGSVGIRTLEIQQYIESVIVQPLEL